MSFSGISSTEATRIRFGTTEVTAIAFALNTSRLSIAPAASV
nr:MAG TPA: hypothetical protein [Caudoviricetes sp.]